MASSTRSSLLVLALAVAPLALAGESVEAQARRIALEGKKAFDTGDYATAITRYQEAYKLKAAPGLLFNLGQCHRKTGAFVTPGDCFEQPHSMRIGYACDKQTLTEGLAALAAFGAMLG